MTANKLELKWRSRTIGANQRPVDFLDFVVDGRSFKDRLKLGDFASCLGWFRAPLDNAMAEALLPEGNSGLISGRRLLYVCPECGDLGCGAITAQITLEDGHVKWSAFGYENGYDEALPDLSAYEWVRPLSFESGAYRQVIEARPPTSGPN